MAQPVGLATRFLSIRKFLVTRALFLVALLVLLAGAAGPALAQTGTVVINEVESSGGTPGDWIELYNNGGAAVNISGFVVKDNDDTHLFVIPSGTNLAAGAYYVVDTDSPPPANAGTGSVSFGLGGADSARLYNTGGTLLDTYTWTTAAAVTYGRCPNGTGSFINTVNSTKGAANDCYPVRINEIESSGGTPGDWIELFNAGTAAVNISSYVVKDNDDTHLFVIPAGTNLAAGAYYVVDTDSTPPANAGAGSVSFGLGGADSARLYDNALTLLDSYTWTTAAAVTYGRCPNSTGSFANTASSTKGAANDCGGGGTPPPASPVKINEVESSDGTPVDWIELYNPSAAAADISGFILRDNDNSHTFVIPAGTVLAAGAFRAFDVDVTGGFGLGNSDSARLFDSTGTTLFDSFTWTSHALTPYGRCPDGTGNFTTTPSSTKGAANACLTTFAPWPGGADVSTVDVADTFTSNLSGLKYEGGGSPSTSVLWAVRNGPSLLYRLIFNGTNWVPDTTNGWGAGKTIVYPSGTGGPDSEGVTIKDNSGEGIYVSTERDNNNNGVSRSAILRFDPSAGGTTLTATDDWNLTSDLPPTGANLGAEAVVWIPDTFLTGNNFFDSSKGHVYNPAEYPSHGNGLFFVGIEADGNIYVYALNHDGTGTFTRIAAIVTGLTGVMDLAFDPLQSDFWAVCDDTCQGHSVVLRIDGTGKFVIAGAFQRPANMGNFNNEGFTITPESECDAVSHMRPVFWSDDSNDEHHAIRRGTLPCSPVVTFTDAIPPKASPTQSPAANGAGWNMADVTVAWHWADNPGGSGIDNANCTTTSTSSGEGSSLPLNAACKDLSANTGNASYTVKVDKTDPIVTASAKTADNLAYASGTWTNQTVTVHYDCSDAISGVASCSGDTVFSADGASSASGSATDNAGRTGTSNTISVKVDKTAPSIVFTGNAGSYTVDEIIAIDCSASDALSGLASSTCPDAIGPAYSFPLGTTSLDASATDNAGNASEASTSFTVGVTFDSLSNLVQQFLASTQITAASNKGKSQGNGASANSLLAKLDNAAKSAAKGNNNAKSGQLGAFINECQAQSGKALTPDQAAILIALASQL